MGILIACGLGWLATNALPSGLRVDPLGPAYYPRFVLLGMAALALALLVASVRDLRRASPHPPTPSPTRGEGEPPLSPRGRGAGNKCASRGEGAPADPLPARAVSADREAEAEVMEQEALPPVSYPRMLGVLGLSLGYVLLLESLGYFLSTLVYVTALLLLLRVRNPLAIAGCALGVPLVLDSLFGRLLGIPLPGGVLDRLTFLP